MSEIAGVPIETDEAVPRDVVVWMQPCSRCKGPRSFRDLGIGRCEKCRAETGEAWPRPSA
jgi:hypothetical protein